jgi:N-acetyl-alpha-D-muramate 1-phosphate uridylyltransferase
LVINLAWLGDQIRDFLGDGTRYGVSLTYSAEHPHALETAGGIYRALPLLAPGPFAVVNGDVYCEFPLHSLRIARGDDAHLVLVPNPEHHERGDFGIAADRAQGIDGASFTFSGISMYRMAFFDGCVDGAFPLKPLLLRSIAAQRCGAQLFRGRWEDVGTPARLAALDHELCARAASAQSGCVDR